MARPIDETGTGGHGKTVSALHILIPIHDFNAGGTEVLAFRLAERWMAAGHRVSILAGASDGPLRDRTPQGANVHILAPERPRSPLSRLTLGRPLADVAAGLAPDTIFIPGLFHFILGRALRSALPYAVIVGKISNPLIGPPLNSGHLAGLARPVLRAQSHGIDWFTAISTGMTAEAKQLLGHDRVSTVPNPNARDDDPRAFTTRLPHAGDAPLKLLLVGRLEPQKNVPLALATVDQLRRERPVHLRICGDGALRGEIEREIARRGLGDIVTLAGFTPDPGPHYDWADLLLITSRFEGGPAVAPEALALGLPMVSTDCSHFLRDFIVDPRIGTLVAKADPGALARAVDAQAARPGADHALAQTMLAPMRASASAARYLTLFEQLRTAQR